MLLIVAFPTFYYNYCIYVNSFFILYIYNNFSPNVA